MKKVFKKTMAGLLAAISVFSLAACKGEKAGGDGEVPTLTWYMPGDPQSDMQSVQDAMNKIIREKAGAEVKIEFIDQAAYKQRMNLMMASGKEFDLCHTGYALNYNEAIRAGGLMEISDVIEKAAPDIWDQLPEYAKSAVERNGEIYAIPNIQIYAKCVGATIRKDLADKYNLDLSKVSCIEDLEPFLQTIKENEPQYYPLRWGVGLQELDYIDASPVAERFAYVDNKTGEIFNIRTSQQYMNRVHQIRRYYEAGYIRSDIATAGDDSSEVNAGKYAVEMDVYKPGGAEETSNNRGIEYVSVPITTPVMENGMPSATLASVSATSKHPEEAVKVLYLINTDKELYNLLCFGIEGKHYTLLEDGLHVKPIEGSGYYQNCSWKFGNIKNSYLVEGEPDDKWEATNKMNLEAKKLPTLGFVFDTSNVGTEITQVATIDKQFAGARNGSVDPDTVWDEYISRLEVGGMTKIFEEEKRQFIEWRDSQK